MKCQKICQVRNKSEVCNSLECITSVKSTSSKENVDRIFFNSLLVARFLGEMSNEILLGDLGLDVGLPQGWSCCV